MLKIIRAASMKPVLCVVCDHTTFNFIIIIIIAYGGINEACTACSILVANLGKGVGPAFDNGQIAPNFVT